MSTANSAEAKNDQLLGSAFAKAVAGLPTSTPQLRQAVLRDLLANDASLWPALRHLVEQPGFEAMLQEPNEAVRHAQRDALLHDLETWCNQTILQRVESFLNGALQRNSNTPEKAEPADQPPDLCTTEADQRAGESSEAEGARSKQEDRSTLTASEEAERLTKQAFDCHQLGDHAQAIELCTRALELDRTRISTMMQRARSLAVLGESHTAIRDYDSILRLQPNNPEALTERGQAWAAAGLIDSAKQDWEKAWRLGHRKADNLLKEQCIRDNQTLKEESRTLTNQGIAVSNRGDHEEAIRLFTTALERDTNNLNALALRGQAYASLGNRDEAKRDWLRASLRGHQQAKVWLNEGRLKVQEVNKIEAPSQANSGCGALAGVAALGFLAIMVISALNTSSQPPASTADKSDQASEQISQQLSHAQELATNARLICEHQQVLNTLSQINESQANASQLSEKKQLSQKANAAIRELDAPGKDKYWEDCSIGVGYQAYDKYNWIYGEDFRGTLFAVASKRCSTPAVQLNTYSDEQRKKKIHSQWISFNPDPQTGKAGSIPFTVPASVLPQEGYIWWDYQIRCNA